MTLATAESAPSATDSSATTAGGTPLIPEPADVITPDINPFYQRVGSRRELYHLSVTKTFEVNAAHWLPYHLGKCRYFHGHNYKIDVTMEGPIHEQNPEDSESGMLVDFSSISTDWALVTAWMFDGDHCCFNEWEVNPTAERLALRFLASLRNIRPIYTSVTVWETDDCCATATYGS